MQKEFPTSANRPLPKKGISDYRTGKDRGSNEIPEPVLVVRNQENSKMTDTKALESIEKEGDFQVNSETVLCQNS
ncbi:hypothetical protein ES708_04869 [subsurface metagenome]